MYFPMERRFKSKIFLVDDNPFSLRLCQQQLLNLGYQDVSVFSEGIACLDKLHEQPEIIFLDHNMDGIDGFEVLKKVKQVNPNIYVVMISGQEHADMADHARACGAFEYILRGEGDQARMENVLLRIDQVREMLRKTKPSIFRRILSIF